MWAGKSVADRLWGAQCSRLATSPCSADRGTLPGDVQIKKPRFEAWIRLG